MHCRSWWGRIAILVVLIAVVAAFIGTTQLSLGTGSAKYTPR